jgi:uncharacterized damage-inducible protein DinB
MATSDLLVLGHDVSVSPLVGGLLGMLRYARLTTLQAVRGLTPAELDHRHDAQSNSIGMLLAHIAAIEAWYQTDTFDEREWTAGEVDHWRPAADLGPEAVERFQGRPLEQYVETLAAVRARTERELSSRGESWLLDVHTAGGDRINNYWKWFHVCEDEINHRGQIRWLRKRLPRV